MVNLFVKEGDTITKDQPVLELENEKAVATIPSTAAGTIGRIYVKAGDKISVGQRILSLTESGAASAPTCCQGRTRPCKQTRTGYPDPFTRTGAGPERGRTVRARGGA